MAQLWAQGMLETEKLNAANPYKISNCEFWYSLGGLEKIAEMKLKRDYFQTTCNKFYKLGGTCMRMTIRKVKQLRALLSVASFIWTLTFS